MALLDHFHPPLSLQRHWHAFNNAWATYIAAALNLQLPPGYFAEPNVQFGLEIDVATFDEPLDRLALDRSRRNGGVALTTRTTAVWTPPAPTQTIPFPLAADQVEVLVFDREAGPTLVGAIELVSPANKDRPAHRDAFVSQCLTYLHQAIGLVVVDIVTARSGNLHDELMARLSAPDPVRSNAELYAVAYRPVSREGEPDLDLWLETLEIGDLLPTMPLWLPGAICLPIELDATYERTCQEQRITLDSAAVE
jgi:hypothetical protein